MGYTNGLDKEAFLQHMFEEFPSVFDNSFAREMLENIVDYGTADNFTHTKNELFYFLKDMIPEVEPKDLIPFMDKAMLTNEVLSLLEDEVALKEPHLAFRLDGFGSWGIFVDGVRWFGLHYNPAVFEGMSLDDLEVFIDKQVEDLSNMSQRVGQSMAQHVGIDKWSSLSDEDISELKGLMFDSWADMTDGMRYVSTMDELKRYFEKNGWTVEENYEGEWYIERKSPLGYDFEFLLEHWDDVEKAIQEFRAYAQGFIPEREADLLMDDRRGREPEDLLEDMEKMREMLDALADGVAMPASREVDCLIADATSVANEENKVKQTIEKEKDYE